MNKEEVDLLDKVLSRTNEWLKFAEAKNGAIIAVVCSVMFGANRIVLSLEKVPYYLKLYLAVFFLLSFLSLIVALSSFIPRLSSPFWMEVEEKKDDDNPFYFGHACKYDSHDYLILLGVIQGHNNRISQKIAEQIVVNSRIASIKLRVFAISVWLFLSALTTPIGAAFIWLLRE